MKGILLVTIITLSVLPWQTDGLFFWFGGTKKAGEVCDNANRCKGWPWSWALRCECGVCTKRGSLGKHIYYQYYE